MVIFGSSSDLPLGLLRLGIGIAILGAIAFFTLWLARKRGSTTVIMDVALTLSGWWVALSLLGLTITVVNTLTGATGFVSGASISLPWPSSLPCDALGDTSRPALSCGSGTLGSPWVTGSSIGVRALVALSQICTAALSMIPAALIGAICFLTLRGHPFTRTVTRSLFGGAIALLLLGIAVGTLPEISGVLALREAISPESEWYPEGFELGVSLPVIGGALALAALAAVFREGTRLQHDREQLERENARLQRDTEGLV